MHSDIIPLYVKNESLTSLLKSPAYCYFVGVGYDRNVLNKYEVKINVSAVKKLSVLRDDCHNFWQEHESILQKTLKNSRKYLN
jgi:hypothetical protein